MNQHEQYQQMKEWAQSVIPMHVPKNCRKYYLNGWLGQAREGMFGQPVFPQSIEKCKAVDENEHYVLFRVLPTRYFAVLKRLLSRPVTVGESVQLNFYKPRDFDGLASDGSEDPRVNGARVIRITGSKTLLPATWPERSEFRKLQTATWQQIGNEYLTHLIQQLEDLQAVPGRNLVDVLIGAKASRPTFVDPPTDSYSPDPLKWPSISTYINSARFVGKFTLRYDRAMDLYEAVFECEHGAPEVIKYVYTEDLPKMFLNRIEDDSWQNVQVLAPTSVKRQLTA